MAQSKYLRRVNAVNQNAGINDVERGWDIGAKIGGSFEKAISEYQKNSIANKLMNTMDAPRAAMESPPSYTGPQADTGGPQPAASDNAPVDTSVDTSNIDTGGDLSTDLPEDVSNQLSVKLPTTTFLNPATGNIQPLSGTGGVYRGTNTDLDKQVASQKAAIALPPITVAGTPPPSAPAPAAPVMNTAGTKPHRGGVAELELMEKGLELQGKKADIADKLSKASGTGYYAEKATPVPKGGFKMSTGGNNPWDQADGDYGDYGSDGTDGTGSGGSGGYGRSKKPPPYVAGSFDAEHDAPNDDLHKIQTDFDGWYGKGAYAKVAPLLGSAQANPDGSYSIKDPKDDTKILMTIDKNRAKYFLDRLNNVGNRTGISHIGPLGEGYNRYSNAEVGTEENPVIIHNNREFFSLPYGTVARDTRNGMVIRRKGPTDKGATHG